MATRILFRKLVVFSFFLLLLGFFGVPKAHATITNFSDTITTSRPSAAAPLSANVAANATSAQIYDNGSIFLASDSALIYPDTGETIDTGKNVASMSASGIPSTGNRMVYLSGPCVGEGCFIHTHHAGTTLIANVTAMHTITFTTSTAITTNGTITITFPGSGSNIASPSATGFSFNGLAAGQITCYDVTQNKDCLSGAGGSYTTNNLNTITITLGDTVGSASSDVFKINIGCTAKDGSGNCTTQSPRLINPTKSAVAGTADVWKFQLHVSNSDNDTVRISIATIESVQVQATVDPTLTFTIAALNNTSYALNNVNSGNTAYNSGNCQTEADTPNSGIPSSPTSINLGFLNNSTINLSAQLITISTNGIHGYSLTATASGHLIDSTSGFWIRDRGVTPGTIAAGAPWFGIHPCGGDVNTTTWGTGGIAGSGTSYFGWPTATSALTIASNGVGPIGISGTTDGITAVEYAGAVDVSVPAGTYLSTITYTATPSF